MEYEFRGGQYVRFIGISDNELLENGEMYEIIQVDTTDNTVQLWLNEGCDDGEYIDWWVSMADVMPKEADIKVDMTHPHWKVIKKVKQMYARRQAHGYPI
jgi:hypothetical protein